MRKNINRRNFLKKCVMGVGTAAILSQGGCSENIGSNKNRPNILWIIAEDLSPDLGCYGDAIVKTPNIDKLASQGACYTNAFVTSPVCSPCRSGLMTGMYQTSIGAHNHRSHRKDGYTLPEPVKLFTDYFNNAGYFTACCGQTFYDKGIEWDKPGKTDFNFSIEKPYEGTDWRQRKPGQPFYSQVNCYGVHRDFFNDPENPIDPNKVDIPPYYPDHPLTRRDWADYLEYIQILDKDVGKILKRLEDDGLVDNTIVFFFGDHGRAHVRDKQFLYDGGIQIPLIIRWPGHIKPGTIVNDMVSSIDFGPTSLKMAGIEPPKHMEGQNFFGAGAKGRNHIIAARDRCDETIDRIRCVRTREYKYIRNFMPKRPYTQSNAYKTHSYPVLSLMHVLYEQGALTPEQEWFMAPTRAEEELYDLKNDPYELYNLAEKSEHQKTLKDMRQILQKWIQDTNDQGQIPEDPNAIAGYYNEFLVPAYNKTIKSRRLPENYTHLDYLKWWEHELLESNREEFRRTSR